MLIEHVDAYHGQVGRRAGRLLHDARDAAVDELCDSERLGVLHRVKQYLAVGAVLPEAVHKGLDAPQEEVVTQIEDEGRLTHVVAGDLDRVGDTQRRVLLDILHAGTEGGAVAHGGTYLIRRIPHDDGDVSDAALHQLLDGVKEDRLIGDRHKLLGARVGEGPQTAALATAKDEALERAYPLALLLRQLLLSRRHLVLPRVGLRLPDRGAASPDQACEVPEEGARLPRQPAYRSGVPYQVKRPRHEKV